MARGKAHSEEVKAQVMAALLAGQATAEVAAAYKIPERTVQLWRNSQIAEVCAQKQERIAGKVLDYLDELFGTLGAQMKVFRDPNYLKKQSAAENATLHGVLADKGFRGLDALARLEEGESQEAGE
jgi:hypothetical protein